MGLTLRRLRNADSGFQDAFLGKRAKFADIHRAAVGSQRQRRTTHVNAIERRSGGIQICRATPDAPFMIGNQRQIRAITIERGELPREVWIDINDQVAAGAEFFSVAEYLASQASFPSTTAASFSAGYIPVQQLPDHQGSAFSRRVASCLTS